MDKRRVVLSPSTWLGVNEVEGRAKSRRLFVGVVLDEATRRRCADVADKVRRTGFDARYEAAAKFHITLAFLGYVPYGQFEAVAAAMSSLANLPASRILLDRLSGFPHERRPRVVAIGARQQGSTFELANRTRACFTSLGFAFDKDPVAHVTIARVKAPQRPLPPVEVEPIPIEIAAVSLFESLADRAHNTSRYEIRSSVSLTTPT